MLRKMKAIIMLLMLLSLQLYSAELTVSQTFEAQFTSIQSAVNAAKDGDVILIIDSSEYRERVVIENKNNLVLQSKFNNDYYGFKPIIKWQDKENVGPTTAAEALIEDKISYYKNGALLINNCKNILVSGIIIDGVEPYAFGYTGIWNGKDPLFHGNAGVTVLKSGNVTIRYCDISNSYFGIYVKDMNEGGAFARPNPYDLETWEFVPFSKYDKTGNHIFEYNRIHNNSWGMFFESSWNHGSVIRYNRIFENHHASTKFMKSVKGMPDGANQPGGAMLFKDDVCSPLAIYNNTFYHNFLIFAGHWRPGAQHLIFNNIFGTPNSYWADLAELTAWMEMSQLFVNRMYNCLFSCQCTKPSTQEQTYAFGMDDPVTGEHVEDSVTYSCISQARITDLIDKVKADGVTIEIPLKLSTGDTVIYHNVTWAIREGALVCKPFSESANIRWYEMKFKSTDPASPDFLVPQDDTITARLVKNAGWADGGVYNRDGTVADIGAPALSENLSCVQNIVPLEPLFINIDPDTKKLTMLINCQLGSGDSFPNPSLEYIRFINDLPFEADGFGSSTDSIKSSNIIDIPKTITLNNGINVIEQSIDISAEKIGNYGFLEMIAGSKTGADFKNSVGFIPYKKMSKNISIDLKNISSMSGTGLKQEPFILNINISDSVKRIGNVSVRLISKEKILRMDGSEFKFVPVAGKLTYQDTVMFSHSGDDALILSAVDSSAISMGYILCCSNKISINGTAALIPKKSIASIKTASSRFALFSLNGRKAGSFSADQLNIMQTSKTRIVPSGIYFAVPESKVKGEKRVGKSTKIMIP